MVTPIVYIVEDETETRELLVRLFDNLGHAVATFASAEEFLEGIRQDAAQPRCAIAELRLPGMDGLRLQQRLSAAQLRMPMVFLTAHATVPAAVQAMRMGAIDFLEKPLNSQLLLAAVQRALQSETEACRRYESSRTIASRLAKLTPREREVLDLLVTAHSTKEIASRLAINAKTVFVHRARVMEKMGVDSLVELSRLLSLEILPERTPPGSQLSSAR